jgi:N-hydroxyarylamine O-acetyltransferase
MLARETSAYLERIGYGGPVDPSAEILRKLHIAHIRSVPFENLDIHLGRSIALNEPDLYSKIVRDRRGGLCYELNGLFCGLLRGLGFSVSMLSAGVATKEGGFGPDYDHMALLVSLERPWLADVGFGDSFERPLALDTSAVQEQEEKASRVEADGTNRLLLSRARSGEWQPQYRFSLEPRKLEDYAEMCRHHQFSPLSHFTRQRVVTLATSEGRITLSGTRLIATARYGQRSERDVADPAEYKELLVREFGIRLE